MKNEIELLSPAGNIKSFDAACAGGCNAIYMGLPNFNARAMAENFSKDEYINCILKAHILNIKVYLTLNTLLFDDELEEALKLVLELYNVGLDAVIVQDIGLAMKIHELLPDLPLHASTQMSVYSLNQVKFLKEKGFKRVVLARELNIDEIEFISKNTDIELEVFVHGALCVSYSGQCLMSALIGSRSANRGKCAQPCRMRYSLIDSNENVLQKSKYLLSKKDTYGLEYIGKLKEIGVHSLKIEGRNKLPEYVYLTTKKYRKYIDNCKFAIEESDEKELLQIFNRSGRCTNYLDGIKKEESITLTTPKNTGLFLGKVLDQRKEFIKVKLEEDIDLHDGIEIYNEDKNEFSTIVTCIKDDFFNVINKKSNIGKYVWLGDIGKKVSIGSNIYKTSSASLNQCCREEISDITKFDRRKILLDVEFKLNKNPKYTLLLNNKKIVVEENYLITSSISKSISIDDIKNNLLKDKDYLFQFEINNYIIDNNIYIPISVLNELRRNMAKTVEDSFLIKKNINIDTSLKLKEQLRNVDEKSLKNEKASLFIYKYNEDICYDEEYIKSKNLNSLKRIYIDISAFYNDLGKLRRIVNKYNNLEIFVNISNIVGKKIDKFITEEVENIIKCGIKGFLLGSFAYIELLKQYKEKYNLIFIADYSLNITNSLSAMFMKNNSFDSITPSYELSILDMKNISKIIPIEIISDKMTVMTSRYCILSSFLRDKKLDVCSRPCQKDNYKLKDEYNFTYEIYTDSIDCISRLVRIIRNIDINENGFYNIDTIRHII